MGASFALRIGLSLSLSLSILPLSAPVTDLLGGWIPCKEFLGPVFVAFLGIFSLAAVVVHFRGSVDRYGGGGGACRTYFHLLSLCWWIATCSGEKC